MVNIGAGFATCGATSLVHTFAIFAAGRVYDQVRNDVCYPGLNVKVVGSHAGLTVGEEKITDPNYTVTAAQLEGEGLLVRKGKKTYHRFTLAD